MNNPQKNSIIFSQSIVSDRLLSSQLELKVNDCCSVVYPNDGEFGFYAYGRKDIPITFLKFPIKWSDNIYADRNWLFQLNTWRIFDNNIQIFEEEKKPEFLIFPKKIVLDWYREHFLDFCVNPFSRSDMVMGCRAMRLAYLISQYQYGYLLLNEEEKQCFSNLVEYHLDYLLDEKNVRYNNHTLTDVQGMGALAQVVNEGMKIKITNFLDFVMPKLIKSQFNDDYIHIENSPEYHSFAIKCFKSLDQTGWFSKYNLDFIVNKANEIKDNFLLPDGRVLPFGDSTAKKQDMTIKNIKYKKKEKIFNKCGYFIYRDSPKGLVSNTSYLAMMAGLNSKFHKQSDDLSLFWFEGEDILSDVGKYAYKANPFRDYAMSVRAHNTIEIDDSNYYEVTSINPEQIFGNAIKWYENHSWGLEVDSEIHRKRVGKNKKVDILQKRKILYMPNKWLCVVDILDGKQEHNYKQWFNFSSQFGDLIKVDKNTYTGISNQSRNKITIKNICPIDISSKYYGQKEPVLQGWMGEGYANMVPCTSISFSQINKKVHFITVLYLNDNVVDIVRKNVSEYILICDSLKLNIIISNNGEVAVSKD